MIKASVITLVIHRRSALYCTSQNDPLVDVDGLPTGDMGAPVIICPPLAGKFHTFLVYKCRSLLGILLGIDNVAGLE